MTNQNKNKNAYNSFVEKYAEKIEDIFCWTAIIFLWILICFVLTVLAISTVRDFIWLLSPEGAGYNVDTIPLSVHLGLVWQTLTDPWTYILTIPIGGFLTGLLILSAMDY